MNIPVRQMLVKDNKYKVKCPYTLNAESITIHNTYNDASANNEVQYMINNNNQVSYHFAIDDKEVVQGIPLDRNAWAAGDGGNGKGNRSSIQIEICYSKSGGELYKKAEALTIKFVAQLLKERGWGIDRVKKHQDWSGKYCPHRILDEGSWNSFLNEIKKAMNVDGWKEENSKWYYYKNGSLVKSAWVEYKKDWYYLDKDGAMATSKWILHKNKWYYLGPNGVMKTGWIQLDGKWYYLNSDGDMVTGLHYLTWNGKKDYYFFNNSGVMLANTTIKVNSDGTIKL
ncbi:N-acetylmuramoyl-L-alanine amidase [Fredinandcohnia sp. 179-A 10B2 NHS]|uniref:peptidoglycan recognition protein family protein n=1 Tax=Fredinandcohnia sp. 179-A 10B2 NHS TaxID=3235176 RepID=UPI0039A07951